MALSAIIEGGSNTAGKANVDANYRLTVVTPDVADEAGFVCSQTEVDAGLVTASRLMRSALVSAARRQAVGTDNLVYSDSFNVTAQNTAKYKSAATTFTFGHAGGYLTLNNSAITTTGASQIYQSWRTFPLFGPTPLILEYSSTSVVAPGANMQLDLGYFAANVASAPYDPTDGVFYRTNSTGLYGGVSYAGTETLSGLLLPAASLTVNTNGVSRFVISTDGVEFWAGSDGNLVLLGVLPAPAGNGQPLSASAAPFSARLKFTGTASTAYQCKISGIKVTLGDLDINKPWNHTQAGMGLSAYQGQNGGTMGSTALYTNSLAAGAGVALTNTTAAAGSGLGGQFSVQPTLAAGTDGILQSYQNPAGGTAQTPVSLLVSGVRIQGMVTTALTGGPVLYAVSLAFGHSAVSLATAEAVAAKAPRRIALGYDTYAATAAVGTMGQLIQMTFDTPIVVNPAEFIATVVKNLGTVTSAGVITYLITLDAYVE